MFKKKKMKLLVVVFIVIHITILAASAHGTYESFFGSNSPIAFTWGVISNGKAVLTINDDYIDYIDDESYTVWSSSCPNEVNIQSGTFNSSNVLLSTPTITYWDNAFGSWSSLIYGITQSTTSDSVTFGGFNGSQDWGTLNNSSKQFVSSAVFISPYLDSSNESFLMQATLTHELGHTLGLGHSDNPNNNPISTTTKSIMRMDVSSLTYNTPQNHDKTDIANKY